MFDSPENLNLNPDELAAFIRRVYDANARARAAVTDRLLRAKLAFDAQYSPDELAYIHSVGGSDSYYPITKIKCTTGAAWIRKILGGSEKPWAIEPTPDPDLSDPLVQQIVQATMAEMQRITAMGLQMTPDDAYEYARDVRELMVQYRNERAADAAKEMERLIEDELVDGGFKSAFNEFLADLLPYPAAFLRCVKRIEHVSMVESAEDSGAVRLVEKEVERYRFERISPLHVFPAAGQKKVDDGNLVIVSLYSLSELGKLAGVSGYNATEIAAVIAENSSAAEPGDETDPLAAYPEAKLFDQEQYRQNGKIAALEFYGAVPGRLLKSWCVRSMSPVQAAEFYPDSPQVPLSPEEFEQKLQQAAAEGIAQSEEDAAAVKVRIAGVDGVEDIDQLEDLKFYEVYAVVVRNHCIYCSLSAASRYIYSASYRANIDSIWGEGIADLLHHVQRSVNSLMRSRNNNLALAGAPQVIINTDAVRLKPGEPLQITPFKQWFVSGSGYYGAQKPFELMQIPDVSDSLSRELEKELVFADRISGIPEYSQGVSKGAENGAAGTASGLSMLLDAASNQIKDPINNIDEGLYEPLIRDLYYDKINDPEVPDSAKGDFKIHARGAIGLAFKEQSQIRRREFFSLVLQSPLLQQILKPEGIVALTREVVRTLDMPVKDIVPSETEFAAQQQQLQLQQQAAAAQSDELHAAIRQIDEQLAAGQISPQEADRAKRALAGEIQAAQRQQGGQPVPGGPEMQRQATREDAR